MQKIHYWWLSLELPHLLLENQLGPILRTDWVLEIQWIRMISIGE